MRVGDRVKVKNSISSGLIGKYATIVALEHRSGEQVCCVQFEERDRQYLHIGERASGQRRMRKGLLQWAGPDTPFYNNLREYIDKELGDDQSTI